MVTQNDLPKRIIGARRGKMDKDTETLAQFIIEALAWTAFKQSPVGFIGMEPGEPRVTFAENNRKQMRDNLTDIWEKVGQDQGGE